MTAIAARSMNAAEYPTDKKMMLRILAAAARQRPFAGRALSRMQRPRLHHEALGSTLMKTVPSGPSGRDGPEGCALQASNP